MKIVFLLLFFTLPLSARSLFVKTQGDSRNASVILIHGSPGTSETFARLFSVPSLDHFYLQAPDRPGYGKSHPGHSVTSLSDQARLVAESMDHTSVIVGYSYGGAVAVKLALLYPEKVKALILLAPALNPELEKLKWWQSPAYISIIRNLLPSDARVSMEESIALPSFLHELALNEIKVPVVYVQGLKDKTVSLKTADYVKEHFTGTHVSFHLMENIDHHLPEKIPALIAGLIEEQI